MRELRGSAPDTSYGLNDSVSRRAIKTPSWTTGIGCAAFVLETVRQGRATAKRAAHRSQRRQDREGSRCSCRARSGGLCWSFTAIWLPDQRRGTGCVYIQDGRSVPAQEHGHAAGLRSRRRDLQGSRRSGAVVSATAPGLQADDRRSRPRRIGQPAAAAFFKNTPTGTRTPCW